MFILPVYPGYHGNGIYHNIYQLLGVYLKYIPVVSFELRCQNGIYRDNYRIVIKYVSNNRDRQ